MRRKRDPLAEAHRLRAYDAVHLGSAVAVHHRLEEVVVFASWDLRLGKAAKREGLDPLPPPGPLFPLSLDLLPRYFQRSSAKNSLKIRAFSAETP
jgi:hypothetical protein